MRTSQSSHGVGRSRASGAVPATSSPTWSSARVSRGRGSGAVMSISFWSQVGHAQEQRGPGAVGAEALDQVVERVVGVAVVDPGERGAAAGLVGELVDDAARAQPDPRGPELADPAQPAQRRAGAVRAQGAQPGDLEVAGQRGVGDPVQAVHLLLREPRELPHRAQGLGPRERVDLGAGDGEHLAVRDREPPEDRAGLAPADPRRDHPPDRGLVGRAEERRPQAAVLRPSGRRRPGRAARPRGSRGRRGPGRAGARSGRARLPARRRRRRSRRAPRRRAGPGSGRRPRVAGRRRAGR